MITVNKLNTNGWVKVSINPDHIVYAEPWDNDPKRTQVHLSNGTQFVVGDDFVSFAKLISTNLKG